MPDPIDKVIADMTGRPVKHCTACDDGINYDAALIAPDRIQIIRGAVKRAEAVALVGEHLVARADADPGVKQVGW